jgi:putative NADPH-quinone reductase
VVLRAHPLQDSFNHALATAWAAGCASTGATVEQIDLAELTYDPRLHVAYRRDQPLEPDLQRVQAAIANAAHLTVAFPLWWGSTPAALKGLFDRAFLPGWAFRYVNGRPQPGLTGRQGRVLVTMDAPTWYDRLVYRASARRQVARATLQFSGIKPVRISAFGSVGTSDASARNRMLARAQAAGEADGRRLCARFAGAPTARLSTSG